MNKKQLTNILVVLMGVSIVMAFVILYLVFVQGRKRAAAQKVEDSAEAARKEKQEPVVLIINNSSDDRATAYPKQFKDSEYKQVGLLVSDDVILPLFGKLMQARRDRWAYYASADKQPLWKVPVIIGKRNCMEDDVGCDEILNGDDVQVPIYKDRRFKATVYKKDIFNPIL